MSKMRPQLRVVTRHVTFARLSFSRPLRSGRNSCSLLLVKALILFAHPALERSRANLALLRGLEGCPDIFVHDLYEAYPDFEIDVPREKALLMEHGRVIFQFPFYWYSTPSLLKEWFDLVLEHGWAYGSGGTALHGKEAGIVVTTGGAAEVYQRDGANGATMGEFLLPLFQTFRLCGMRALEPCVIHGALKAGPAELELAVKQVRLYIEKTGA